MLSRVPDVITSTKTMMTMPPPKKVRIDSYGYQESNSRSNSSNGSDQDNSPPTSVRHPLQGTLMPSGFPADLETFRVLEADPSGQSGLVMNPRHDLYSQSSVLRTSKETSVRRAFSTDIRVIGTDPRSQRTSWTYDVEPRSLEVDTIDLPQQTLTTPSSRAEVNDAPLDLSNANADNLRRTLKDQICPRSQNHAPSTGLALCGGHEPRPESDVIQRSTQVATTSQLPLFVNLENSRLDSIQLGLHLRRSYDTLEKEYHKTKALVPPDWATSMNWLNGPEVESPRRQKNAIDRLRAHLERRQEARPSTSTAYASLSKCLAAIEATGNRYETVHDGMLGAFKAATDLKTSSICMTEAIDTRGRNHSNLRPEQKTQFRNLEVQDQAKRCVSGVSLEELQLGQQGQRLKHWLQSGDRRDGGPCRDGERRCAASLECDETSRQDKPSAVSFERHPQSHWPASDHSMEQMLTDVLPQDTVLSKTQPDPHSSRRSDFGISMHAIQTNRITQAYRSSESGTEPEPDSPSSHSLPELSTRSDASNSTPWQASRLSASVNSGFPFAQNSLTKNDVAVVGRSGSRSGRTLETCSPDQSTDAMIYKADNLPSIIASARLDDDCDFPSSFAKSPKETSIGQHQPMNRSTNDSFCNRRNATLNGIFGSGKGSPPEPPSSTFEDEPMADKNKVEDTNNNSTEAAIPCKICQDVANGFHYGVWSCEGCKAFFKRSITGSANYVCPADNNCTINRLRKKSCQACRLRKCYEYGMSPGNCRGDSGSKFRKRKLQETNLTDQKEGITNDHRRTVCTPLNGSSGNVFPSDLRNRPTMTEPDSGPASFLQHLVNIERPIRFADFVDVRTMMNNEDSERIQLLTTFTNLINLQLMDIVTWSLSLTGFSALNLNIRTHLLISSWSDILLLTSAFQSLQCTNAIVIAPNLHLTKERCETFGMMALYNRLMAIVRSFQQLVLTHKEMLLMQAILLINGAPQLLPRLNEMHASLMRAWYQNCSGDQFQAQDYRISQLLLLLPHIRHCSSIFLRFLADLRRDSRIPFYGLLQDVTDSGRELDQVSVLELLAEEDICL